MGVADPIYRLFPIGYKNFFKPGPFTRPFHRWGQLWKDWSDIWLGTQKDEHRRLLHDWIDLWIAALTPTTLNYFSKGVCAPFPFLEELIDFTKLKEGFPGESSKNAYNITDGKLESFEKMAITPAHIHAALAFPFVYPSIELNGKHYYEGADFDPIDETAIAKATLITMFKQHREGLLAKQKDFYSSEPTTVVLIDVLGQAPLDRLFVRTPRHLWDAYGTSILTSVAALAKRDVERFQQMVRAEGSTLLQIKWPSELFDATITDWSYSNISRLWEHGYQAGRTFCNNYQNLLPDRQDVPPTQPLTAQ
jgi:hypothetical protein